MNNLAVKHDAKQMFQSGELFLQASEILFLQATVGKQLHLGFAYGVLSALALETYIKCLLEIETGQFPNSHNLIELVDNLPKLTRAKLKKRHNNELMPAMLDDAVLKAHEVKGDWDSLLEECQDAFILMRYPYEAAAQSMKIFGVKTVIRCVREFLVNNHLALVRYEPTSPAQ